jgi:alkylation response protein AidB-like acyl-CoA dehydrogenase
MSLAITDEERMLRDAVSDLITSHEPLKSVRKLRDLKSTHRHDAALWNDLVGQGFAGVLGHPDFGGAGFGARGAGLIATALGFHASAVPFVSSAVLAGRILNLCGTEDQKADFLPKIFSGERILAVAIDEHLHHGGVVTTRLDEAGGALRICGQKSMVMDGDIATHIIILAFDAKGAKRLVIVPSDAPGLVIEPEEWVDHRIVSKVFCNNVLLLEDQLLAATESVDEILADAQCLGYATLAAELVGAADSCFQRTLDYMRQREQFGRLIGEFQALQHRAAMLYSQLELARSTVIKALDCIDRNDPNRFRWGHIAKAKCGEIAKRVAAEAVQLHGGIAMTDEFDLGLIVKRIMVLDQLMGRSSYHTEALAILLKL